MLVRSQQAGLSLALGLKMIDNIRSCYPMSDKRKEAA